MDDEDYKKIIISIEITTYEIGNIFSTQEYIDNFYIHIQSKRKKYIRRNRGTYVLPCTYVLAEAGM